MYRRIVLLAASLICLAAAATSRADQSISPDHFVSPDKGDIKSFVGPLDSKGERKAYKGDELKTIGMPVGGICAGQLYVRGDGTLANWWIANNAWNTGYGIDWLLNFDTPLGPWHVCYQTFEPLSYIDQGFSVTVRTKGGDPVTRTLSKKDFDDISFYGEYPIAYVEYGQKQADIPVSVSAEFFSPFVPLDARRSATPGTIMNYTVKNTSDAAVDVDLKGWMQNLVCIDLRDRAEGVLQNKVTEGDGFRSIYMDMRLDNIPSRSALPTRHATLFEDFESGAYGSWKVEGEAFSEAPVQGKLFDQTPVTGFEGKYLVNSFNFGDRTKGRMISKEFRIKDKYITFLIAGGSEKGKTCINLVIGGKTVMSATGNCTEQLLPKNWDVSAYKGKKAHIEIVDDAVNGWGHICVDKIEFADQPVLADPVKIGTDHPYFGNLALSVFDNSARATADENGDINEAEAVLGEKLNGALTSSMTLAPGESRTVTFVLSWFFPNRPLNYGGSSWNRPLPPSTPAIGNMYSNWFGSSIDVVEYLHDNMEELAADTRNFHDCYYNSTTIPYWIAQRSLMSISTLATETCQWWGNGKFWAWEGVGSCDGTCTHVWGYAQALANIFPELERNLREKTDYANSFRKDGGIFTRNGGGDVFIDGHCTAILRTYREHLMSPNNYFLARNWDKVKRAVEYLIAKDGTESEPEDGIITCIQPNTYDISFNGANTYVGSLYLAALRAGEKMALVMKDYPAAERFRKIYTAGSENTVNQLWNGEYFFQDVDLEKYPLFQYGNGCLSDQIFGQTWSELLRLGDVYPAQYLTKTYESIFKYNWTNDVKAQSEAHLPERYYAHNGEPGLFICTWPHDKHFGEAGVRYRDEVWTGIEYQVATGMIADGMLDEGLAIFRGADSRYDGLKHNPWNEIECGDHYARAMASYGVLRALEGYWYDGPCGLIAFDPKIGSSDVTAFFTAAEGWGNLSQKRAAGVQTNAIELKYGHLTLSAFQLSCPGAQSVRITLNGKELKATLDAASDDSGLLELVFPSIRMKAGDVLLVELK